MPGCIVSATTASFSSVEKRRLPATPVITSTFENVSDISVCLGLSLGPPAIAGVRSKRGALQGVTRRSDCSVGNCDLHDESSRDAVQLPLRGRWSARAPLNWTQDDLVAYSHITPQSPPDRSPFVGPR